MKLRNRITAIATGLALAFAYTAVPALAASEISKDETVYIATDATGAEEEVIVSEHLKNGIEAATIDDMTNLTEIENVKGEESFRKGKGDQIIWQADGNDIFYEGKTSEKIPVSIDISYKLDGQSVKGSQLEGKSGDVEIRVEYSSNAKAMVNGKETDVPFIAMTGFVASDESFSDIEIDHGKVIDDGDKKIVVGMAAPGMNDALDIDPDIYDIDLNDSVTVKCKAKNFDLRDMMTVITNSVFEDIDTEDMDIDFDDEISALNKGGKALVDGSKQLYSGMDELNENAPKLDRGMKSLKTSLTDMMPQLTDATSRLSDGSSRVLGGMKEIKGGLDGTGTTPGAIPSLDQVSSGLRSGADSLRQKSGEMQAAETYAKALDQYMQTVNQLVAAHADILRAQGYGELVDKTPQMAQAAAGLASGLDGTSGQLNATADRLYKEGDASSAGVAVAAVSSGLKDASNALGGYDETASEQKTLIGGQTEIYNGLSQMNSELVEKSSALDAGLKKMTTGTAALVSGTAKLEKGSLELSKGMRKYYNDGIRKLVDLYENDLKGSVEGLRNMIEAGQEYKSFTKLPEGMDGSVKFIYRTSIY